METDAAELFFIVIPAILGLALIAYVGSRIAGALADFRRTLRGWLILAMVAILGLYWIGEIVSWMASMYADDIVIIADLWFVVLTAWLAVCMSALGSRYRHLNHVDEFRTWFREHPLNSVTLWGMAGIAVTVALPVLDTYAPEDARTWWLVLPAVAYLVGSMVIVLIDHLHFKGRGRPTAPVRSNGPRMVLLAVGWFLIPVVVVTLGVTARLESLLDEYNPHSWILILLGWLIARAVSMPGMRAVAIDSEVESVRREGFREYDIPRGAYLIHDEKSDAAFGLFSELTALPLRPDAWIPGHEADAADTLVYLIPQGLIVTREFPDKVRQKHNLQTTPIIWLTETAGERRIAPTSLSMLADTIVRFMESNPNSIVLLEGIEYISTYNDFRKVLRFLDNLNEAAWITKARLIVTVDPKAFEVKDLALLERDRNVIRGSAGVEDLRVESRVAIAAQQANQGDSRHP